ncbi:GNAT family N-acetyltransferase [Acinetobacter dispersus]|uniref:GNAT family N-acetyltransferase n=1 Tax=Acinetobacter dispersus TaxID=70348 RepID=UPI00132EDE89|nr:GNAT family protein [Acinetobacter dispersus]MCH7384068.1 GNAT family N-acetyltransferase [Acinetobacter dispersus]QHH97895.1 GNAT family N-acetyltransferase [Acinetobacter dispersus]
MKKYLRTQQNQFGQSVGFLVESDLPSKAINQNLVGQYVKLIHIADEISDSAANQIWEAVSTEPNAACWTYLPYSAPQNRDILKDKLQNLFGFKGSTHFLIEVEGEIQGWIALLNPRLEQGAIEIGNVYFSHKMKKSKASTEVIFLLLQQCFVRDFRRVEWKCDDCNAPSKAAALRFGFQYEGLFRQDRITKGHNRNTAWFSIIDEEWPALEKNYQQWLSPENFDAQGFQKQRLSDFIEDE